jgi:hypothetical protein
MQAVVKWESVIADKGVANVGVLGLDKGFKR